MASFQKATAITPITSHTYSAHLHEDWCIGSVPHGGFVTALFLNVAKTHFHTTLAHQNQPHTITLHLEFLRRTRVGPATFSVKHVKLGSRTSIIHMTLTQDEREEVVGYATNSNFALETGPTLPTHWELYPAPDVVDLNRLSKLRTGGGGAHRGQIKSSGEQEGQARKKEEEEGEEEDVNWKEVKLEHFPHAEFRKALTQIRMFLPRWGQKMKSISDEWICFRSGEKFTNASVGYVSDAWPQVIEAYRARERTKDTHQGNKEEGIFDTVKDSNPDSDPDELLSPSKRLWYPTVLLNLDVKKSLPEEGVDFLFARVQAKQIRNGRYDVEVTILDEQGDIVALSHHVCLVLGAERNTAARKKTGGRDTKL